MSYVLSLRVFLPRATPLPSLSAAAVAPPQRRRVRRRYPPMPTPCRRRRRRMYTIAVGRRRRFASLSFAAAAVAGDNGRRLSAEHWVGTSMYIRMYNTTTHSGRRYSGVARAACAARR